MARGKEYESFVSDDRENILNIVDEISTEMFQYITNQQESKFVLFYKTLTHSDIGTFGKATSPGMANKNLLYYMRTKEMLEMEEKIETSFKTAHQSCIGLTKKFYDLSGLPHPRDTHGYWMNDYANVYLLNDTLKYFRSKYTKEIFQILDKEITASSARQWNFENLDLRLSNLEFTSIDLHCGAHGLGRSEDIDFHKLRHHMFKGDTFVVICEIKNEKRNLFILLAKNPTFFSIIGETNQAFEDYQKRIRQRLLVKAEIKGEASKFEDEVTRAKQSAWRNMLAKEMMCYTTQDDVIFCPFTYITINFDKLGSLFVASHIKGFADKNTTDEERYDINNGLLLSANADALFDKHLISISPEQELVFSYLMNDDYLLKQKLLLLQPIFKPLLNPTRMKYLEYHYNLFLEMENKRKIGN